MTAERTQNPDTDDAVPAGGPTFGTQLGIAAVVSMLVVALIASVASSLRGGEQLGGTLQRQGEGMVRSLAAQSRLALLSGALAGLAGAVEVAGRAAYVTLDMSPGYGYSGIVIAMLAMLHPLGVVAASVFVAGMLVGADSMSRAVGVPTYIADVIVAVALIAMLVATMLTQYRIRK